MVIFAENWCPLFGITLLLVRDLIRKPVPTFRDHAYRLCVIFSENRCPLFGITLLLVRRSFPKTSAQLFRDRALTRRDVARRYNATADAVSHTPYARRNARTVSAARVPSDGRPGSATPSARAILTMAGEHAEEMLRRELRIRDGENAAGALVREIGGERLRRPRRATLVNLPRDLGELRRFGDHEAMQRKRRRQHHERERALREIGQRAFDVAGLQIFVEQWLDDMIGERARDRFEQSLLAVEVVVDRLARDPGGLRDLIDAGSSNPCTRNRSCAVFGSIRFDVRVLGA